MQDPPHRSTYSMQVGSTHPTGMLSCYCLTTVVGMERFHISLAINFLTGEEGAGVTITHNALDLSVQAPWPSDMGPPPLAF